MTNPFLHQQPLWEITAFSNYKHEDTGSSSALVIRIHHCLADSFALLNLVKSIADPASTKEEVEKHVSFSETDSSTARNKFIFVLRLIFITPIETIASLLRGFDSNSWTIPERKMSGTLTQFESYNELSQDLLKHSAKLHGTSVCAIIFAGFSSAVRKTMMMGQNGKELTKEVTILYPWEREGHPGRLTNHL